MQKIPALKSLLLPDTDKVKKMKTYEDLPINKYSHILSQLEFSIASCYSETPRLTDEKVFAVLESLLTDLNTDLHPLEYSKPTRKPKARTAAGSPALKNLICEAAISAITEKPVTQHEFGLCLQFIMYSIDNRSWVPSGSGYLDWISNMFGILPEGKKEGFDEFYDTISQMFGIKTGVLTMDEPIDEQKSEK